MGWQNAAYTLMSGRWFSADECKSMGLVWRVTEPETLLEEAMSVAQELAINPIPSLIATKQLMMDSGRPTEAWAAHKREIGAYAVLLRRTSQPRSYICFYSKTRTRFSEYPRHLKILDSASAFMPAWGPAAKNTICLKRINSGIRLGQGVLAMSFCCFPLCTRLLV